MVDYKKIKAKYKKLIDSKHFSFLNNKRQS